MNIQCCIDVIVGQLSFDISVVRTSIVFGMIH